MDWNSAIRRNREQLKAIVLTLVALTGLRPHRSLPVGPDGRVLFILPRSVFAMIMLVLRPAESCVRRLILIAAHGLVLMPRTPRDFVILGPRPEAPVSTMPSSVIPTRAFKLFDPLKNFDPESIWDAEPTWESGVGLTANHSISILASEEPPLDATHLGQRLNVLLRALDTIPAQARRLVRYYAKRDAALKASKPTRMSPMRPGLPPGWRERKIHEIDDVLRECHGLAHYRLNELDTG